MAITRKTELRVVLTAEQVSTLLQVLEQGRQVHPADVEMIAIRLRGAVPEKNDVQAG